MKSPVIKSVLASALALTLLGGQAYAENAVSEADESTVLSIDNIDPYLYEGMWVSFEGGYDMYLPAEWSMAELTDEETEAGILLLLQQPDSENSIRVLSVSDESIADLASLEESLQNAGCTDLESVTVNDYETITYNTEDDQMTAFSFLDNEGDVVTVGFTPKPGEDSDLLAAALNVLSSLSETSVENTSEVTTE